MINVLTVFMLPDELLCIVNDGLSNINKTYHDIADELASKGYKVSISSIGRYQLQISKK